MRERVRMKEANSIKAIVTEDDKVMNSYLDVRADTTISGTAVTAC